MAYSEEASDGYDNSVLYLGDVVYVLDKEFYSAGDTILSDITVSNLEDFPLSDCYLVIHLVEGEAKIPNVDENVFYENITSHFTLAPRSSLIVPFQYVLPSDIKSGTYRLEVYLVAGRSPVVGMPFLFMGPRSRVFRVDSGGVFPYARIMRNETVFMDVPFQGGPLVNSSSQVAGTVFIQNNQTKSAIYTLNVSLCEWDDTSCGAAPALSKIYSFSANPISMEKVEVTFDAPAKPQAYSIRLELREESGRLISLYRSRVIVSGEAARIRKAAADRMYYKAGNAGKIMLLISPSPDQETFPVINDAKISVSITTQEGEQVYSDSSVIPEISLEKGLLPVLFNFSAPVEIRDYTVCSSIASSTGMLLDEYCFFVDSGSAPSETNINSTWGYDPTRGVFSVELCASDASGLPASAIVSAVLMSSSDSTVSDYLEEISLSPCLRTELKAPAGDYTLLISDQATSRQFAYSLNVQADIVPTSMPVTDTTMGLFEEPADECGNGVCGEAESAAGCCADCGCEDGQECVDDICISAGAPADNNMYYAAAGIILLLGIILYLKRPRAGRKAE